MNVGKRNVMRCSKYGNGGRMHAILIGKPLEEVGCFKYLGLQVAADGGCEMDVVPRMYEGFRIIIIREGIDYINLQHRHSTLLPPLPVSKFQIIFLRKEVKKVKVVFFSVESAEKCAEQ